MTKDPNRHNFVSRDMAERVRDAWPNANNIAEAMKLAGVKSKTERRWYRIRKATEKLLNIELPAHNQEFSPEHIQNRCTSYLDHKKAGQAKSFIVTSATNNSNLNARFFDALELFAGETSSQLLVVPLKYRHNTLISRNDYKWPERIYPYAVNQDVIVNKSLLVSSLNVIATAVNPLSGLQENSASRSAIYGHTQVALESIATPGNDDPKIIATTGSCTSATYTKTKSGGKAKFHHSFSAVYVKIVGQKFHLTQVHWDGKGFYLLSDYWTPDGRTDAPQAAALVQGDSHAVLAEKVILDARKRLMKVVKPKTLIWHDLLDMQSQSHHSTTTEKVRLAQKGLHVVEEELKVTANLVNEFGKGYKNIIVGSNHHDHLQQWLDRHEDRKDPVNAPLACKLKAMVYEDVKKRSAFELWMSNALSVDVKFASRNKACMIGSIDVGQHGDKAANGARGSANAFGKLSAKTIIGHSHSPQISRGCYQVGVSTKNMSYNQGYSSWAYADAIIYPNNKRCLIFYIGGKSLVDLM